MVDNGDGIKSLENLSIEACAFSRVLEFRIGGVEIARERERYTPHQRKKAILINSEIEKR